METAITSVACKARGCANSAVIVLLDRHVCLNHFFSSCYERLELLEPMIRCRSLDSNEIEGARLFLKECCNRALFISLRYEPLTNLDRSRLLELLLSCGDLEVLLKRSVSTQAVQSHSNAPNSLSDRSSQQDERASVERQRPRDEFASPYKEIRRLFFI